MSGPSPYAGTTPVAAFDRAGDGRVTLVEGQTFSLSERSGDMVADLPHGVFLFDTRVLSRWCLRLNGHRIEPLAVELTQPFAATFVGHGAPAAGHADSDVVVVRRRHVGRGMREWIQVTNHGFDGLEMVLELECDVDFAGLFEVKEGRRTRVSRSVTCTDGTITFLHDAPGGLDRVEIHLPEPTTTGPGAFTWRTTLPPDGSWHCCVELVARLAGTRIEPRFSCSRPDEDAVPTVRLEQWRARLPRLRSDSVALVDAYERTSEDLGALRIFDPDHPDLPIVAAGAPWFMTVFGRDSLLTASMTLVADPSLAHGVLRTLARFQGKDVVASTEEEPGKILHEMRFGAATGLSLGGGEIYYGSIDSTPLFVMLLGELRRWESDDRLLDDLLPHADRALEWIQHYGDRDGDGYVEYQRSTDRGLANQGWKDSWDAVRRADGTLADPPIALCEVQGYVHAAYLARAELAEQAGDAAAAARWFDEARRLRERFNEDFWSEEHGWYVLALDRDKRPVDVLSSNIGHCLWTRIIDPDRAATIADRLMSPEMFSGFGVRTLSSAAAAFNPISYHNGSVWPHDNALCAAGLARYGYVDEANRIIEAQLDVADHLDGRLPELFAGFTRADVGVPAPYPTSCSPQAWSSASPLLWLRAMLRLVPSLPGGAVWVDPRLPRSIRHLEVSDIRVGDHHLSVRVHDGSVEIDGTPGLQVYRGAPPVAPGDSAIPYLRPPL